MHIKITYSTGQAKACIKSETGPNEVISASHDAIKEFIINCLDAGWDVDLITIL